MTAGGVVPVEKMIEEKIEVLREALRERFFKIVGRNGTEGERLLPEDLPDLS